MTKMDVVDELEEIKTMLAYMSMSSMGMLDMGDKPSETITLGGRFLFDHIEGKLSKLSSNIELHATFIDGE
jgi:hypothetical protein